MQETNPNPIPPSSRPVPKGAIIEFCGEQATVVQDDGGPTITVNDGVCIQQWYWVFEGEPCRVVSLPE